MIFCLCRKRLRLSRCGSIFDLCAASLLPRRIPAHSVVDGILSLSEGNDDGLRRGPVAERLSVDLCGGGDDEPFDLRAGIECAVSDACNAFAQGNARERGHVEESIFADGSSCGQVDGGEFGCTLEDAGAGESAVVADELEGLCAAILKGNCFNCGAREETVGAEMSDILRDFECGHACRDEDEVPFHIIECAERRLICRVALCDRDGLQTRICLECLKEGIGSERGGQFKGGKGGAHQDDLCLVLVVQHAVFKGEGIASFVEFDLGKRRAARKCRGGNGRERSGEGDGGKSSAIQERVVTDCGKAFGENEVLDACSCKGVGADRSRARSEGDGREFCAVEECICADHGVVGQDDGFQSGKSDEHALTHCAGLELKSLRTAVLIGDRFDCLSVEQGVFVGIFYGQRGDLLGNDEFRHGCGDEQQIPVHVVECAARSAVHGVAFLDGDLFEPCGTA